VEGQGVKSDYVQAYYWSLLGAAGGQQEAAKTAAWLRQRMTPEQIAAADQLPRTPERARSLRDAARAGDLEKVKALLTANPKLIDAQDEDGFTPRSRLPSPDSRRQSNSCWTARRISKLHPTTVSLRCSQRPGADPRKQWKCRCAPRWSRSPTRRSRS